MEEKSDTSERHTSSELNNETKIDYNSKPGLYQLIFSSRLKLANFMHCPVLHGKSKRVVS